MIRSTIQFSKTTFNRRHRRAAWFRLRCLYARIRFENGKPLEPTIGRQTAIHIVSNQFELNPKSCFATLWAPGWMPGKSVINWTWIIKPSAAEAYFVDAVNGRCWKQ